MESGRVLRGESNRQRSRCFLYIYIYIYIEFYIYLKERGRREKYEHILGYTFLQGPLSDRSKRRPSRFHGLFAASCTVTWSWRALLALHIGDPSPSRVFLPFPFFSSYSSINLLSSPSPCGPTRLGVARSQEERLIRYDNSRRFRAQTLARLLLAKFLVSVTVLAFEARFAERPSDLG